MNPSVANPNDDTGTTDMGTPLDHLFPPTPEITPEEAEEGLRRIAEAMETVQQEETLKAGDKETGSEEEL